MPHHITILVLGVTGGREPTQQIIFQNCFLKEVAQGQMTGYKIELKAIEVN